MDIVYLSLTFIVLIYITTNVYPNLTVDCSRVKQTCYELGIHLL